MGKVRSCTRHHGTHCKKQQSLKAPKKSHAPIKPSKELIFLFKIPRNSPPTKILPKTILFRQDKLNNTLEIIWVWSRDLGKAVGTRKSTSNRKRTSCVTHSDAMFNHTLASSPEIRRYLSCKQPNMLRMFERPTPKLWEVSPKLIFASDKYLLKLLLTAVPKKSRISSLLCLDR